MLIIVKKLSKDHFSSILILFMNFSARMFLIRVLNDFQWIFDIKKRIQLVKTVRLSTHIDIFGEVFFWIGIKKI